MWKACDFINKRLRHRCFSCDYCKIFKNTCFTPPVVLFHTFLICLVGDMIYKSSKPEASSKESFPNKFCKINRKTPMQELFFLIKFQTGISSIVDLQFYQKETGRGAPLKILLDFCTSCPSAPVAIRFRTGNQN